MLATPASAKEQLKTYGVQLNELSRKKYLRGVLNALQIEMVLLMSGCLFASRSAKPTYFNVTVVNLHFHTPSEHPLDGETPAVTCTLYM